MLVGSPRQGRYASLRDDLRPPGDPSLLDEQAGAGYRVDGTHMTADAHGDPPPASKTTQSSSPQRAFARPGVRDIGSRYPQVPPHCKRAPTGEPSATGSTVRSLRELKAPQRLRNEKVRGSNPLSSTKTCRSGPMPVIPNRETAWPLRVYSAQLGPTGPHSSPRLGHSRRLPEVLAHLRVMKTEDDPRPLRERSRPVAGRRCPVPVRALRAAAGERPDDLRPAQPGPRPARLPGRPRAALPGQRDRRLARRGWRARTTERHPAQGAR